MLTSPTGRDSEKLWPSLAVNKPSTSNSSNSFFGDKAAVCDSIKKSQPLNTKTTTVVEENRDDYGDDSENECKAPVYKNNLSDALASALKAASLNEVKTGSSAGKKKKSKKTLIFSSGMNFN